ncbi:MAG: hypothetical protein K6F57_04265 [Candidatus Saccharibacteria bacterium]|nr:hypothetical protein [Candidatus Saccharibacteria bacterium]
MEKMHEFMGNLLDQRGITDIDEDARQHLIEDMTELLMEQIDRAAIEALPEDKAIELANGLDDGSIKQEDVPKFMTDAGLNLEEISMITMLRFRDLYLGTAIPQQETEEATATEAVAAEAVNEGNN